MKGWYVNKDTGEPLCWTTKGDKPGLEAAGHPFIPGEMPDGNTPFKETGTPYKYGLSGWVKDDLRLAERIKKNQVTLDKENERKAKIAKLRLHNNKDLADLAALIE